MRFRKFYVRATLFASLILALSGCQSAQKPVALLPPVSTPALKPAPQSAPAPVKASIAPADPQEEADAQKPASAESNAPAPSAPASDAVAELISKVEKEYQAGLENY